MKTTKPKRKQLKSTAKALTTAASDALDSLMAQAESSDALLDRLGVSREQAFAAISSDDEVESCKEDLRTAMLAKTFRLWGDDVHEDHINRLWKSVRRALPTLVEATLTAKLNGYSVLRYVYQIEDDGFLDIASISHKADELAKYTPQADGRLLYNGQNGEEELDLDVMYQLITCNATSTNPAGEMAGARLYPAVAIRKQGFIYAAQFIRRYAQPYLVGKIDGDPDDFTGKLYQFLSGGAMSMDRQDSIEMLQNNADGSAFARLEKMANTRIQKALLGKVKTADLENGSRAAQETEEHTKGDRLDGYLYVLGLAAQHLLDALLSVNAAYGKAVYAPQGLWFEFNKEAEIDINRAERDAKYCEAAGLRLTRDYYIDVLGFEEHHFEIAAADSAAPSASGQLSAKLSGVPTAKPLDDDGDGDNIDQHCATDPDATLWLAPQLLALQDALQDSDGFAALQEALERIDHDSNLTMQRVLGESVIELLRSMEAAA